MTDVNEIWARHLAEARFEDLPVDAVHATKRAILDTIGCIFAGSGLSDSAGITRLVTRWGGTPESSMLGHGIKVPAPLAAYANGCMAHQVDFDDIHDASVTHPTANSLPCALAVAEAQGQKSGTELLRAIVLANDLVVRLGLAVGGELYAHPWARPATLGAFGGTAAAAVILGLEPRQVEWAFGLTLHQASITLECLHSPDSAIRGLRDGFSCRNAVFAAYMAAEGIKGDRNAFEGRFGFYNAFFRGEYTREPLVADLGRRFHNADIAIKLWPSARETHATIQAALELRHAEALDLDSILAVELRVGSTNIEFCEPGDVRRYPNNRIDALRSLPFIVARAIAHGNISLKAFMSEGLQDAATLAIAKRVVWVHDQAMNAEGIIEPGDVTVRMIDGRVFRHRVQHAVGHPDNALSDGQVCAKAADCAALGHKPLEGNAFERLRAVIMDLENRTIQEVSDSLNGGIGIPSR